MQVWEKLKRKGVKNKSAYKSQASTVFHFCCSKNRISCFAVTLLNVKSLRWDS